MGIFDRLFGRSSSPEPTEESPAPAARLERELDLDRELLRFRATGPSGMSSPDELPVAERLTFDILENLVVDEAAELHDGEVHLPLANIPKLDPSDQEILELLPDEGWLMEVRVGDVIGKGRPDVRLRWTSPDGTYGVVNRGTWKPVPCGFVETETGALAVLPGATLAVRELIEMTDQTFAEQADEFRFLARLQKAISKAREEEPDIEVVRVDGQLEAERYVAPDKVRIDFRQNEDGSVELRPIVDGWNDFEEAESLAEAPEEKRVFTLRDAEQRTRVALDEDVRREVSRVRKRSTVPAEDVETFVQNPRAYLQPAEESAAEREDRARRLGVDVTELEEEDDGDTLDLTAVMDRIGELRVEDYGSRVKGFTHRPNVSEPGRSATSLEDWKGEPGEEPPEIEKPWEVEPSEEEEATDDEARLGQPTLIPSANDEEVEYEREVAVELAQRFEELGTPELFAKTLYPHQEEGYAWLRNLNDPGSEAGGLLADDMGLGKTVQIIALFCHLKAEGLLSASLLVVPKSTIPNWKKEIGTFFDTPVEIYEHRGPGRLKSEAAIGAKDVVITTYSTLRSDQLLLGRVPFQVMVCDEAQYIKNYTTSRARACQAMNARLRVALTATPVENQLDELWSVVDFSQPGLLGSLAEFRTQYAEPIEADGSGTAARRLLDTMRGHYLRRTKDETLEDLPEKYIHRKEVPMSDVQLEWYEKIRTWYHHNPGRGRALKAIQNLLAVCTHPYVPTADRMEEFGLPAPELRDALQKPEDLWPLSSKMLFLKGRLDEIRDLQEKVILFCKSKRMQKIMQTAIKHSYGFLPKIINGDVAGNKRQEVIDVFNERGGFRAIIMSPRAAGIGVNVQGANHVIHVMREWNPAKENQATDRAYRIGQTKDVHVHVPIATHPTLPSLDVRLDELMRAKMEIARHVLRPSASAKVGVEELEEALDG